MLVVILLLQKVFSNNIIKTTILEIHAKVLLAVIKYSYTFKYLSKTYLYKFISTTEIFNLTLIEE